MPTLSAAQWRTLTVVTASVTVFLLAQPEVQKYPWAMVLLGALNVAVAAIINPPQNADE